MLLVVVVEKNNFISVVEWRSCNSSASKKEQEDLDGTSKKEKRKRSYRKFISRSLLAVHYCVAEWY